MFTLSEGHYLSQMKRKSSNQELGSYTIQFTYSSYQYDLTHSSLIRYT